MNPWCRPMIVTILFLGPWLWSCTLMRNTGEGDRCDFSLSTPYGGSFLSLMDHDTISVVFLQKCSCPWIISQANRFYSGIVCACFSFLPSAFNRMLFICWKRNLLASVKYLISSALLTATSANVCCLFPPSEVFLKNNKGSWGIVFFVLFCLFCFVLFCFGRFQMYSSHSYINLFKSLH